MSGVRTIGVARQLSAFFGLLALGCQPGPLGLSSMSPDEPWPSAAVPAAMPPAAAAPAAAGPRLDPDRQARAAELLALAAQRSGLAPAVPLPVVTLPRARLAAAAVAQTERDLPRATADAYSTLLRRLELAPPGFDYLAALTRLLAAESAALYDPERGRIALAERLSSADEQSALAHELAHLLQDRHFELQRRLADPALAHDARGALMAVIEGSATLLARELVPADGDGAADDGEAFASSGADTASADSLSADTLLEQTPRWPAALARSLAATYADGEALVASVHARGGWAAVHRLLAAPPTSTAQILHPEQLQRATPALPVAAPAPPDASWRLGFSDVLGEQTLRVMLEEALSPGSAGEVASGWAGDRVALFRSDAGTGASVWHIVLQSDAAAERLLGATREAWLSALDAPGDERRWCRPQRDGGVLGAWREGQSVVLLSLETRSDGDERDCARRLDEWSSVLAAGSSPVATRVGTTSPVAADPAPEGSR